MKTELENKMEFTYIEEGPYRYLAYATELADGTWEASVAFEPLKTADPTKIRGMRYVLTHPFATKAAAMDAALNEGDRRAKAKDVDL